MLDVGFLLSTASHARPLSVIETVGIWDSTDVLLGSTGLECGLSSLEVTSVVLGTDDGEDKDIGSHDSDEDTLNEGIIGYNFWAS